MRRCVEACGSVLKSYNASHHITGQNPIRDLLTKLDLMGTNSSSKFIPKEFFLAPRAEIVELLVGLIHTDGSLEGDNIRYYTVSKALAEGVKLLCLRLGIYASISKDSRKRNKSHKDVYRVTIRRPYELPLLGHKSIKRVSPERKRRTDRLLTTYEKADNQEIYCITVDHPDHAFICNGFVVSNTAVIFVALDPDTDIMYVYDEYSQGKMEPEIHAARIAQKGSWMVGAIDPASRGRSQVDGQQLIRIYRQLGLKVREANNEVESGIYKVWSRLSAGKLKFFPEPLNYRMNICSIAETKKAK
jgi:hypothetical protein